MRHGRRLKLWVAVLIMAGMILGSPLYALAGENDVISEVRELLRNEYVDPVSDEVLKAATVQDMLAKLGDSHTVYMAKAEYNHFLGSLDRAFSGIGIELEIVPLGVLVTKAIPGYGAAKAGIKAGDIITEADGVSFAGKSSEFCISKLRGPQGTKVQAKVQRGSQTLSISMVRMVIELPLVASQVLENRIGYLAVYSFGTETAAQFDQQVRALKDKGVDRWIIDLRNNGGGYTQAALELLGYIIGDQSAVLLRNKSLISMVYNAKKQAYTLAQPIILLSNRYTGSSSEIVTAAIKDHGKATIIGETTIGSGRVKALMPLSNGDYLKMTVHKFFSPNNSPIDEVGINPHLDLTGVDELKTAVMMLKHLDQDTGLGQLGDKTGYLQLSAGPNNFALALEDLRKPENWLIGKKVLDSGYVTTTMKLGKLNGWAHFPERWLQERHKMYYPEYVEAGNLKAIPLGKVFTITFSKAMDWDSVSSGRIELIMAGTGERVKTVLAFTDATRMTVTPQTKLKADAEYWMVIHPTLKDAEGRNITGGVAVARTVK